MCVAGSPPGISVMTPLSAGLPIPQRLIVGPALHSRLERSTAKARWLSPSENARAAFDSDRSVGRERNAARPRRGHSGDRTRSYAADHHDRKPRLFAALAHGGWPRAFRRLDFAAGKFPQAGQGNAGSRAGRSRIGHRCSTTAMAIGWGIHAAQACRLRLLAALIASNSRPGEPMML